MNFTLRQWAVIAGLSAVFIVAAIIISNDTVPAEVEEQVFDEVVWCENANAISTWRSMLDGSLDGDSLDDLINLRTALDEARDVAPEELRTDVARLYDFTLLTVQAVERAEGDLDAALIDARNNTDQERVEQAILRVSASIEACGHTPLVNATA